MDIYSILSSKPHNPHYLNRYITFIEQCQQKNIGYEGYTEDHHICPKAKDMFPEYKDFRIYPWNCAVLTARQHFIAHIILWKAFPDKKSCLDAIWGMEITREGIEIKSSILYEKLRFEITNSMKNMVTVKDSKGNTFSVHKDNPLYIAGEYKHVNKGKMYITNGNKNQLIHSNDSIPKGWRKGMTKISMPKTICVTNGIENRRISKNESIFEGWCKGRTGSPVSKRIHITNGMENRMIFKDVTIPEGWQKGRTINYKWITNGFENKQIPKDATIPEGWRRGITKNIPNKKIFINDGKKEKTIDKGEKIPKGWKIGRLTSSTRGKKWITNGKENKQIPKDQQIPQGWRKGMVNNVQYKWITNGKENKQIPKDQQTPNGWKNGMSKNVQWITNGLENKQISKNSPIPEGWKKGRTSK